MKKCGMFLLLALMSVVGARGQWVQEQIELKPGWNAVYLTVQPQPSDCDDLFAGVPQILSVWRWNQRFTPVDFDMDPSDPFKDEDAWLRWYPSDHPYRALRNMSALQGNAAHLIRVDTNAAPFTWTVTGTPLMPKADWFEYQLNLMGLPVDANNAPTFNVWFADVPEIGVLPDVDEGEIYEVTTDAGGQQVMQPGRVQPVRDQAYWILCGDKTDYAGPVQASFSPDSGGVLDFGDDGVEGTLSFKNVLTNSAITVSVTPGASAAAPSGQTPLAGLLPLGYWGSEGTNDATWLRWEGTLNQDIAAQATWSLPVCVWRNELMTNAAGVYACILDVKESLGRVRFQVPVRAEVKAVGE